MSGNAGVGVEGSRSEDESGHRPDSSPVIPSPFSSSHQPIPRSSSPLPYRQPTPRDLSPHPPLAHPLQHYPDPQQVMQGETARMRPAGSLNSQERFLQPKQRCILVPLRLQGDNNFPGRIRDRPVRDPKD